MRSIKNDAGNYDNPQFFLTGNDVRLEKEVALKIINEKSLSVCETSFAFNANYTAICLNSCSLATSSKNYSSEQKATVYRL
jgi:hypothetical protein